MGLGAPFARGAALGTWPVRGKASRRLCPCPCVCEGDGHQECSGLPGGVRQMMIWRHLAAALYHAFCLLKSKYRTVTFKFKCLLFSALSDILPNLP